MNDEFDDLELMFAYGSLDTMDRAGIPCSGEYKDWIGESAKKAQIFNIFNNMYDISFADGYHQENPNKMIAFMQKYYDLDDDLYDMLLAPVPGKVSLLSELPFIPESKLESAQELIEKLPEVMSSGFGYRILDDMISGLVDEYFHEEQSSFRLKYLPINVNKDLVNYYTN